LFINTKAESGKTEWFKKGGKFDILIDKIDVGMTVPYISPSGLVDAFKAKNKFKVLGYSSEWQFSQISTAPYFVGYKVLEALGVIKDGIISKDFEDVADMFDRKPILNKEFVDMISNTYDVYVTDEGNTVALSDMRTEGSLSTSCYFNKEKVKFIILVKKSIIKKENYF